MILWQDTTAKRRKPPDVRIDSAVFLVAWLFIMAALFLDTCRGIGGCQG